MSFSATPIDLSLSMMGFILAVTLACASLGVLASSLTPKENWAVSSTITIQGTASADAVPDIAQFIFADAEGELGDIGYRIDARSALDGDRTRGLDALPDKSIRFHLSCSERCEEHDASD